MNTTLQQRLDLLWSVGASFLADNRFLLYHHLSNWLNRLSDDPIPPWNDPLFRQKSIQMIHWFLEAIPSLAQMDRRSFGKNVHEHWQSRYVDDWSLHERIFMHVRLGKTSSFKRSMPSATRNNIKRSITGFSISIKPYGQPSPIIPTGKPICGNCWTDFPSPFIGRPGFIAIKAATH